MMQQDGEVIFLLFFIVITQVLQLPFRSYFDKHVLSAVEVLTMTGLLKVKYLYT